VIRYHALLERLDLPSRVVVSLDGNRRDGFDLVLPFKPPFGPYHPGLCETFPIGQCEVPAWDREMVAAGCRGIRALQESHPETVVSIACPPEWQDVVMAELPGVPVVP